MTAHEHPRDHRGWDVFDPATGATVVHVRTEWAARRLTRGCGYDYARPDEGWPGGPMPAAHAPVDDLSWGFLAVFGVAVLVAVVGHLTGHRVLVWVAVPVIILCVAHVLRRRGGGFR